MKRVNRSGTLPELTVRKELHRLGLRYVIGGRSLPGTPDLVFPKHQAVVFVHGCFWHGHDCRQGRLPSSNIDYWRPKIVANRERDARKERALTALGWRVFTVWECQLKNATLTGAMHDLAASLREG